MKNKLKKLYYIFLLYKISNEYEQLDMNRVMGNMTYSDWCYEYDLIFKRQEVIKTKLKLL